MHGPHPVTEGQMTGVLLARDVSTLRKTFHDLASERIVATVTPLDHDEQ
jgi:hypothetical protein